MSYIPVLIKSVKTLLEFEAQTNLLIGKPICEVYYEEYKEVYKKVFKDLDTSILYNINFGHSYPRCILPYDALTEVDFDNKKITINSKILN